MNMKTMIVWYIWMTRKEGGAEALHLGPWFSIYPIMDNWYFLNQYDVMSFADFDFMDPITTAKVESTAYDWKCIILIGISLRLDDNSKVYDCYQRLDK